jgi:transcriptional regulator with XRE-family HTH domain
MWVMEAITDIRPVGRMVVTLAKATGVTMATVAATLNMHRNTLAEKLAGRRPFTEDEIVLLARLFQVPPGRLFDDPLELLGATGRSGSAWIRSAPALAAAA